MSEMDELPELYEESNDLQTGVMPGEGDLPQVEVGGGSRSPSRSRTRRAQWRSRRPSPGPDLRARTRWAV